MKQYRIFLLAGLFALIIIFAFPRYQLKAQSTAEAKPGFAFIELYTSEGCSSCPPADKLIAHIQQEYKDKQVYVLAYHVDYWNRLGWKDVFSNAAYSQRQQAYAGYLHTNGVYTPQAIINGNTEFVGSDNNKMHTVINQNLAKSPAVELNLTAVKIIGNKAILQYHITGSLQNNCLMLAVIQRHATTQVKAGENNGRILPHINIVHQLQKFDLKGVSGSEPVNLPGDFTIKDWTIIGFVQNNRSGEVEAAQQLTFNDKELVALKKTGK